MNASTVKEVTDCNWLVVFPGRIGIGVTQPIPEHLLALRNNMEEELGDELV